MDTREKLIELIEQVYFCSIEELADHLIANGVTAQKELPVPEIVCDRFMFNDHNGVWMHQFRFKIGDKDWGVSKELPAELVAEGMMLKKWIPVTERLPEDKQTVLAIRKDGSMFVGYYNNYISTGCWHIWTARNSTKRITQIVTHWMPLPEPPKEDA